MRNQYFQFKQFKVNQDKCGMKVCTDSCVFGAWMAGKIENRSPATMLDIGAGTGLLSLMVAQKTNAIINAIEIDADAGIQAKQNFGISPWGERLQVFNGDIKTWITDTKYECIICNPPFYEDDLLPENEEKKISKHSSNLKLSELIIEVGRLLTLDGFCGILLPFAKVEYFEKEALKQFLFVKEKLNIKQSVKHHYFRAILIMERNQGAIKQSEISIRNQNNEYTPEFIELLKDYYLTPSPQPLSTGWRGI